MVTPDDDLEAAIDSTSSAGGGVVLLKAGTHILEKGLRLRSKVTLTGEGRTRTNGIQADHEQASYYFFHKYHMSGFARVAMWFPCEDYYGKYKYTEDPRYAPQNVILNRREIVDNTWGAMWRAVKNSYVINSHFASKKINMGLLKCDVKMENSSFDKGNEVYADVREWPSDVKLLW